MILLTLFLSLYVGICFKSSIILGVIETILILIFLLYKKRRIPLLISITLFGLGIGVSHIKFSHNKSVYNALVVEVKSNYYIVSSGLEKLYVYEPSHYREIGDYLSITASKEELDMSILESEFDFQNYLNNKGVYNELIVTNIEVKFYNPIRLHAAKRNFLDKLDTNSQGVVSSILFGESKESELNEISKDLHLMRLITSSGIYLYFLYSLNRKIFSRFLKQEKFVDLLSILLMSPYLVLAFPKFVVIKFFILKFFLWINKYPLNNKFRYLDVVSISGIVFLLFDYHLAFQDGFFLSYFIPTLSKIINDSFTFRKNVIKKIAVPILISISFIPFTAKFYNEISLLSLPLQFLFTPIYLSLFVVSSLSLIGIPLYTVISFIVSSSVSLLSFVSPITIKLYVSPISNLGVFAFEAIYLSLLYFASIRLRPLKDGLIYFLIGLSCLYIAPIKYFIKDYVSFINVGQGDSTLIKYKNTTVLIDTGGNKYKDIATEVLIPYFKKQQIYRIDLLITTHDDFDHSGAVTSLVKNFTVLDYKKDYQSFPITKNGVTFTNYNVYPDMWSEENDRSLVIGFKLNNYNCLIMGDAPQKIEKAIIKDNSYIPCDILKVGHHGSKTSTSEEFIQYLKPKYGIISCGKNNMYGHPNDIVVSILKKYGVIIRRTDYESTITF